MMIRWVSNVRPSAVREHREVVRPGRGAVGCVRRTASLATAPRAKAQATLQRRRVLPVSSAASSPGADTSTTKQEGGPLRVIVVGAPGSGKGTQCKLVSDKLGLVHISAGDVLREAAAEGTPMGLRAKECMDKGELVPTEVAVTLVKQRLESPDCAKGWLLDGYPRSQSQYEGLAAVGIQPELVVLLDVPDEIILERIVGRRQDPVTGEIYHLTYAPPKTEEIAQRLTQRSDDTEEACRTRLRVHHENVGIVRDAYMDVLRQVDGNRDTMEVFSELEGLLQALRPSS